MIADTYHCSPLLSTTASMELISSLERPKTLLIVGLEMYAIIFIQLCKDFWRDFASVK